MFEPNVFGTVYIYIILRGVLRSHPVFAASHSPHATVNYAPVTIY